MDKNHINPPLSDYPKLSDEELFKIISYYGQAYDTVAQDRFPDNKYRFAYELLQLRHNNNLVAQTERLVNKTMQLARWTMLVGIGTAILAVSALITLYYFQK